MPLAQHAPFRLGASPLTSRRSGRLTTTSLASPASALSAWHQYESCCAAYEKEPLLLSVTNLVAFFLFYVRVRGNSFGKSELGRGQPARRRRRLRWPWPDFTAVDSGDSLTQRLLKIQKDWPAEVRGALALTLRFGLCRASAFLRRGCTRDLWALQWAAILSLMHDMLLWPSDITPLDRLAKSKGPLSEFYPRLGDFVFVPPTSPLSLGGLHFRTALSKMQKDRIDHRLCTAAALEIPSASVTVPRLCGPISRRRICGASPSTPRSSSTAAASAPPGLGCLAQPCYASCAR